MKVEIEGCNLIESSYIRDGYTWSALKLVEASKDLPEFDMPLSGIRLDEKYWSLNNMRSFLEHAKRVNDVDEKYPILLDDFGTVADGWHRIIKAMLAGKETIKAKRFFRMPDYDSYTKPD